MKYLTLMLTIAVCASCERIVNIESPYPDYAKYCDVNDTLMGRWQSDSVWVLTASDSLDTIYENRRPTYYYDLTVDCDDDTTFLFSYINYSGVTTREAYSVNFETNDSSIILYDELDFNREREEAIMQIDYLFSSDTTFRGRYFQELNADQRSEIIFWMRKVN